MFISTAMNTNGIIVNNERSPLAILKQRISTATMAMGNIKKFLQPQQVQQLTDISNNHFIVITKNKIFTGSFQKPGFKTIIDGSDHKLPASPAKIIDIASNNVIDYAGNTSSMTQAQIVYANIYTQQIEWMTNNDKTPEKK